jgi:hypothetical protein
MTLYLYNVRAGLLSARISLAYASGDCSSTPLSRSSLTPLFEFVAFGRYRDGRFANLREDQLIHLVGGEAAFGRQTLE